MRTERTGDAVPKSANQNYLVVKRISRREKIVVETVALQIFFNTAKGLQPKFWVDQVFKDLFKNLPPIPEDIPALEQNQRLHARLMMQDLFLGIFNSMELKGGQK